MDDVERVAQFVEVDGAGLWIIHFKLDDGRRIDYAPISFTEAACSRRDRLLPNDESVMEVTVFWSEWDLERQLTLNVQKFWLRPMMCGSQDHS